MHKASKTHHTAKRTCLPACRYQDAVDINDDNIKQHPHYYKRRQAICEHPFGSIKRHWGYTHTLLKGLQKVNGELSEANHEHKKQ